MEWMNEMDGIERYSTHSREGELKKTIKLSGNLCVQRKFVPSQS